MFRFPIVLDIEDAPCLVVGGGRMALHKSRMLLRAGARVTLVARRSELDPEVSALLATAGAERQDPGVRLGDHVPGHRLVVAATGDRAVNHEVARAAERAGVPCNVVDDPASCGFIFPALVDRDPLVVAISSGGSAPVLARSLKARLESLLPAGLGPLASLLGSWRPKVKQRLARATQRRRFWERTLEGAVPECLSRGDRHGAEAALEAELARTARGEEQGEVALVGAGPGDPDLLTLRALQALQAADVVVHDRLVPEAILDRGRREARRIHVGKAPGGEGYSQEGINHLLVRLARQGQRVVRLKGGDPGVFARAGEEIAALRGAGVAHRVIPGVTAASAGAAAAGVTLTHRDHAHACVMATAREVEGADPEAAMALTGPGPKTLAVYMGRERLMPTMRRLMAQGWAPATPVTVVAGASCPGERVLHATLRGLAEAPVDPGLGGPVMILVGESVATAPEAAPAATEHMAETAASPQTIRNEIEV
jgi:uroporphyrin-III C-methyltransferase/precorrin-2 dehydrogenase/sirohydrochlorin ferrochelatase